MIMPPANLPPPKSLVMDDNLSTRWRHWRNIWQRYEIASDISTQNDEVHIATLLSAIGDDAANVYDTWEEGDNETVDDVLS